MAAPVERFEKGNPKSGDDPFTGYELSPAQDELALPGEVTLRPTPARALDALVADLLAQAISCARTFGDFHLALGGDGSIETLLLRLISDPDLRSFPWDRTHVWITHDWGDDHPDGPRLFSLVREYLVGHADLPTAQAHATGAHRGTASEDYERRIAQEMSRRSLGRGRLDCAVVVIEPNGFAGGWALVDDDDDARSVSELGRPPTTAEGSEPLAFVAMSRGFLNASRMIAVVGLGADRKEVVADAVAHRDRLTVAPLAGELRWYLDYAAAGVEEED